MCSSSFTADGTAYKVVGNHSNVLIFIHGVGIQSDVWQPQIEYFSKTYRVIVYNLLGHAESPAPKKPTLDDYVEQLYLLSKKLHLSSFSLIGHSMGAMIAVAFALKYPSEIKSLVAMNMVFNRSEQASKEVLQRADQMLEANQPDQTQIEKTVARWFQGKKTVVEPKQANQQKIAKVRTWLEQNSTRGYAMAYRIFATSDKIFLNKLAKLAMPVLYLTGDNDKNSTPAMSFQMAQLTPHGSSFSIIGEAHIMAYIAPDKVNPILEKFFSQNIAR